MDVTKDEHPTITLVVTLIKPAGEANMYVRFGCIPQKTFYQTQGKVPGSMNTDLINAKKQVNNKLRFDQN